MAWDLNDHGNASANSEERSVFVNDVEFVEKPEFVCPSLIRLGCVDCIDRTLLHALYLSASSPGGEVFLGRIENRELDMLERICGIATRYAISSRIVEDQGVCYMVKRGPDIVEYVASDEADVGRNLRQFGDVINALFSIGIILYPNCIVPYYRCVNDAVKIIDVLFGPVDFDLNVVKGRHGA